MAGDRDGANQVRGRRSLLKGYSKAFGGSCQGIILKKCEKRREKEVGKAGRDGTDKG
jgi:hypothetical protein